MLSMSHPARGAWIEILEYSAAGELSLQSHPARGAWIEILVPSSYSIGKYRRTPQGVRGLKCLIDDSAIRVNSVAPRKGCVD